MHFGIGLSFILSISTFSFISSSYAKHADGSAGASTARGRLHGGGASIRGRSEKSRPTTASFSGSGRGFGFFRKLLERRAASEGRMFVSLPAEEGPTPMIFPPSSALPMVFGPVEFVGGPPTFLPTQIGEFPVLPPNAPWSYLNGPMLEGQVLAVMQPNGGHRIYRNSMGNWSRYGFVPPGTQTFFLGEPFY